MITIRELQPGDNLAAVLKLCRDFFVEYEDHHKEFFDTDNLCDADISDRFHESMKSDNSATIIALVDAVIVGYASVVIREQPRFYKIKKVGAISALMVAQDYRRRGIATQLLVEAKTYFRRHGLKYFTFYTAVANREAIMLYERLGMQPLYKGFLGET
jgi:ribosomal protein S18 acetylase RimI-like enzyme